MKLRKLRGKSHIEFRMQCVIMTLAGSNRGGEAITNGALKFTKIIEFESSCIEFTSLTFIQSSMEKGY